MSAAELARKHCGCTAHADGRERWRRWVHDAFLQFSGSRICMVARGAGHLPTECKCPTSGMEPISAGASISASCLGRPCFGAEVGLKTGEGHCCQCQLRQVASRPALSIGPDVELGAILSAGDAGRHRPLLGFGRHSMSCQRMLSPHTS